jgi:eukaryotic-like serine/threonine-protein kinase
MSYAQSGPDAEDVRVATSRARVYSGRGLAVVLNLDSVLAGKYRITSVIGEGGFGKVYLGYDIGMDRQVAIKELLHDATSVSPEDWERYKSRFQREAQVVSQFAHHNVVAAYALETDDAGDMYLVLEYVDGGSLKQLLEKEAPLDVSRALGIAIDLAQAIETLDKHDIVHRDIKPSNILVDHDGVAKLTDFGIAQVGHETRRTQDAVAHPGTPAYKSPEQATTTGYLDQRSDIYALGLVLYEMLTGYLYVRNHLPPRHYNSSIPPALDDIVMKCLEENPGDRYQVARDLRADLENVRDQSVWGQLRIVLRGLRSRPAAVLAGVLVLLVLAVGAYRFVGTALRILAAPEFASSSTAGEREVTLTPTPTLLAVIPMVSETARVETVTGTPSPSSVPLASTEAATVLANTTVTATFPLTGTPQATPVCSDLYEPDEKSPVAIAVGETQHHSFCPEGDLDRITFRVKAGRNYVVTTSNLADGVDTNIEVLVNGESYSNDNASPGTLASQVTFSAAEDGMAVVTITSLGRNGPDAVYDVSVFEALPTATPTDNLTLTAEATTTVHPTFTPRPTFTPQETSTYEATLTETPTETPTGPTLTPSVTPSLTPTPSFTPTITPTRTTTPTRTITPTPSDTPTITLTLTPSDTPRPTLTPTPARTRLPVKTIVPPSK